LEASRGDGRRENRQGAFDRTIAGADMFGLPLSSGVAGIMAANGGGLQMATVRNLLMAWVLTLPMAVLLSGSLYWLLSHI
jgi:PiT family inorganic phosphate transporter